MKTLGIVFKTSARAGNYYSLDVQIGDARDAGFRAEEAAFGPSLLAQIEQGSGQFPQRLALLKAQAAKVSQGRLALEARRDKLLAEQKAAPHLHFGPALDTRLAALGGEIGALGDRLDTAKAAQNEVGKEIAALGRDAAWAIAALVTTLAEKRAAALRAEVARRGRSIAEKVAADLEVYLAAEAEVEVLDNPERRAAAVQQLLKSMGLAGLEDAEEEGKRVGGMVIRVPA